MPINEKSLTIEHEKRLFLFIRKMDKSELKS